MQRRVAWFEKQLFGQKSKKRALVAPQEQGTLVFNCLGEPLPEAAPRGLRSVLQSRVLAMGDKFAGSEFGQR